MGDGKKCEKWIEIGKESKNRCKELKEIVDLDEERIVLRRKEEKRIEDEGIEKKKDVIRERIEF